MCSNVDYYVQPASCCTVAAASAALLGRHGVRTIVIDRSHCGVHTTPRAIALDNEALRILQTVGLGEDAFAMRYASCRALRALTEQLEIKPLQLFGALKASGFDRRDWFQFDQDVARVRVPPSTRSRAQMTS